MHNHFKDRLAAGTPAIGLWMGFPSAELAELAGLAGFDFLVIDAEHYAFGRETVQNVVRAAQLSAMTPLARVPHNDPHVIQAFLETGVMGVIAPHISTAAEARCLVQSVKYPPQGSRGAGSSTRAADYGFRYSSADYFSRANDQTMVIPMVEDQQAIANLPQILQVEGLDSVFIGQGDLSLSMGFPGQMNRPEVQRLVEQARGLIKDAGLPLGALGASLQSAQSAFAGGAAYFVLSSTGFVGESFKRFLSAARS